MPQRSQPEVTVKHTYSFCTNSLIQKHLPNSCNKFLNTLLKKGYHQITEIINNVSTHKFCEMLTSECLDYKGTQYTSNNHSGFTVSLQLITFHLSYDVSVKL